MEHFISYGKQWIDQSDIDAVTKVLQSDFLTQGPAIEEFEKAICKTTGAKYCIVVSNGTAALHIAAAALELPRKSKGITTPNTFVASANCLLYTGTQPIFADIESRTYNIDFDEIKKKIDKSVKVIVVVDFAGQPAEMKKIYEIAKQQNIFVIEDASHAIGSKYPSGESVGSCAYSDMTVFSFHPVKTITTGEGGAITTNNPELYLKLKLLRTHGITKEEPFKNKKEGPWYYEMQKLGFNYRMTDFQAALGTNQLTKLQAFISRRKKIVNTYNNAFKDISHLTIPYESPGASSVFHLYVLKIDFEQIHKTRGQFMNELKEKGIGTQVHYIPVYRQPYYQELFGAQSSHFPNCEDYYAKTLSIPLYPKMSDQDVEQVIDAITAALKN